VFTLVVVKELEEYTLRKDATFEPAMDPYTAPEANTLVARTFVVVTEFEA